MSGKILIPVIVMGVAMLWPFIQINYPVPRAMNYMADALIAVSAVFVILRIIVNGRWATLPGRYWFVFLGFVYVCVSGAVLNGVSGDTVFAGVRSYFRYIPIFLLPFAYKYEAKDIRLLFWFFLAILLIQLPVTLYQKFVMFAHYYSGDFISGTFRKTSAVAIFVSMAICGVVALFIDKRISVGTALLLALLFLVPAGMSETKVTPILLMLGVGVIFLVRRKQISFRQLAPIAAGGVLLVGMFAGMYHFLYLKEGNSSYFDLMADTDRMLTGYNFRGVEALPIEIPIRKRSNMIAKQEPKLSEEVPTIGRFDSITMPFHALFPHEMTYLALGLGMANMESTFGSGGDYRILVTELDGSATTLSMMLWEVGLFGTLFFVGFIIVSLRDSVRESRQDTWAGSVALMHASSTSIMLLALVYINSFHLPEVLLPFFFFSGMVAANIRKEAEATEPQPNLLVVSRPA